MLTTQQAVREAFWENYGDEFPRVPGQTQNDYPANVRATFVDFVDALARDGVISERLAERVTL